MKPIQKKTEILNEINDRLTTYFDLTGRALKKAHQGVRNDSAEKKTIIVNETAKEFLEMAQCYYDDARIFYRDGKPVLALCALNYAHGWLDAGARLKLFDIDGDNVLFASD